MPNRVALVQCDVRGFDRQLTALRHSVAGIDNQVYENLLNLARIGFDSFQVAREAGTEFDVFADQSPQHLIHV